MYLFFDTETGGKYPDRHDLLQVYFLLTDDQLNYLDDLELHIKPDWGPARVDPEALRYNKIDLDKHMKLATPLSIAQYTTKRFLERHSVEKRIIPVGWRPIFDLSFCQAHLLAQPEWERHVDYKGVDVASVGAYLQKRAKCPLPAELKSLGCWARHYSLPFDKAHTARADSIMTRDVWQRMLDE